MTASTKATQIRHLRPPCRVGAFKTAAALYNFLLWPEFPVFLELRGLLVGDKLIVNKASD